MNVHKSYKLGIYQVSNAFKTVHKWIQIKYAIIFLLHMYYWFSLFMDSVFKGLLTHQNLFLIPVSTCGFYRIICRHAEQLKIWAVWCAHSNWGQTRWHSALLFQLFYLNKCSSCYLLSTFLNFAFVCFCMRHAGSSCPDQEGNLCPLQWKQSPNHQTGRELGAPLPW